MVPVSGAVGVISAILSPNFYRSNTGMQRYIMPALSIFCMGNLLYDFGGSVCCLAQSSAWKNQFENTSWKHVAQRYCAAAWMAAQHFVGSDELDDHYIGYVKEQGRNSVPINNHVDEKHRNNDEELIRLQQQAGQALYFQSQVVSLQSQLEKLQRVKNKLLQSRRARRTLEAELEKLLVEHRRVKELLSQAQLQRDKLQQQVKDLQFQTAVMESKCTLLNDCKEALEVDLQKFQQKLEASRQEVQRLQQAQRLQQELQDLDSQHGAMENYELLQLKERNQQLESTVEDLQKKLAEKSDELSNTFKVLYEVQSERDAIRQKHDGCRSRYDELSLINKQQKGAIAIHNRAFAQLQNELLENTNTIRMLDSNLATLREQASACKKNHRAPSSFSVVSSSSSSSTTSSSYDSGSNVSTMSPVCTCPTYQQNCICSYQVWQQKVNQASNSLQNQYTNH